MLSEKTAGKKKAKPSQRRTFSQQRPVEPAALKKARARLRPADFGVVHPALPGIRARRGEDQSAADFYEHLFDTRRSINRLLEGETGRRMLFEVDERTGVLAAETGGRSEIMNPARVVEIYSARAMTASPRDDGDLFNQRPAYRYGGRHGEGRATTIKYDPNKASSERFIGLGHEMVHAWRNARGVAVSPLAISPMAGDKSLKSKGNFVRRVIEQHALLQEEFETVGLARTPRLRWAPTENAIREEHGREAREDYSGAVPGGMKHLIQVADELTDDRNWWFACFSSRRSPVQAALRLLED